MRAVGVGPSGVHARHQVLGEVGVLVDGGEVDGCLQCRGVRMLDTGDEGVRADATGGADDLGERGRAEGSPEPDHVGGRQREHTVGVAVVGKVDKMPWGMVRQCDHPYGAWAGSSRSIEAVAVRRIVRRRRPDVGVRTDALADDLGGQSRLLGLGHHRHDERRAGWAEHRRRRQRSGQVARAAEVVFVPPQRPVGIPSDLSGHGSEHPGGEW